MNNNSSILQLLRRYLSGDVGPREEAELERHARSDEFVGEALEGLRSQPAADHEAAIARMRRNLPQREKNVRPIGWYRIAAAASILLLVGVTLFMLPRWLDNSLETMAMKEVESESAELPATAEEEFDDNELELETASDAATSLNEATNTDQVNGQSTSRARAAAPAPPSPPTSPKPIESRQASAPASPEVAAAPALPVTSAKKINPAPPTAYSAPAQADDIPLSYGVEADAVSEEVAEAEPIAIAPPPVIGQRFDNGFSLPAGFRKISGYVTDENDQPIPEANVVLPGQPLGEKTNADGFFELIADNTVRQINVMHPDYQPAEVSLPSGEKEVQINLENNREASEAEDDWRFNGSISTYYPNQTPSAAALTEGTVRELRKAIITNKPSALGAGKVRVSFSVQKGGLLTNFNLGGRSSDALQDYVKRYLQENSGWELIRGDEPARVYLVFNFD